MARWLCSRTADRRPDPAAHERAGGLLAAHRPLLEALATALLDEETLDGGRIHEIAQRFDAIPAPRPAHPLLPAPRREVPRGA